MLQGRESKDLASAVGDVRSTTCEAQVQALFAHALLRVTWRRVRSTSAYPATRRLDSRRHDERESFRTLVSGRFRRGSVRAWRRVLHAPSMDRTNKTRSRSPRSVTVRCASRFPGCSGRPAPQLSRRARTELYPVRLRSANMFNICTDYIHPYRVGGLHAV